MITLLLILTYIAFISLGLPDSILGSAWPAVSKELNLPLSYAGLLSMIISAGTIVSSFFSGRIIRKLGTGKVTVISVFMTAVALLGFSFSKSFWIFCILSVPLGLGAGSVDSALNNFVALHFKAKHMSWLHCFWGIGATAGPIIMAAFIGKEHGWKSGYGIIGLIQICLVVILMFSLPLWKKAEAGKQSEEEQASSVVSIRELLHLKGAKPAMIAFFCYTALEAGAGLWGSSYLVLQRGMEATAAAGLISLYYFGITLGRFFSGFLTLKWNNKDMIRIGQGVIGIGIICLLFFNGNTMTRISFLLIGMGCAPVFPSMLHDTPRRFGEKISQAIMGIQMACAYVGVTVMPPLFGALAEQAGIGLFPIYLLLLFIIMVLSSEKLNKTISS